MKIIKIDFNSFITYFDAINHDDAMCFYELR